MNNTPNQTTSTTPTNQGQYYQPPNYYQQYGYTGNPAPNQFYPKEQPYTKAAKDALGTMNLPLFLILSMMFGWICGRTIWVGRVGIGMTVMGVLFYAFFLPFILHKQGKKIPLSAWLLFIPQIAVLMSFGLYSGFLNKLCGLPLSLAIAMIQTTLIAGCTEGQPFSKELLSDACATYLAYPFLNMTQTVKAVFAIGKDKSNDQKNKVAPKILLGLLISVPVVVVLILVLCHADEMFAIWIRKAVKILNINLGRIFIDIILTAITMLYVMPLVVTLRSGYHSKYVEEPIHRPFDAIVVTTVLFAASMIYLVFVVVQFRYLFAGSNHLPDGYTYAEYCRRGFFELVTVTAVTTVVIAAVCMLTTHNDKDRLPGYTKAALLLISACDCVMIVSAAHRLVIYVREYGMTIARFNAAVIIAFMAVCIIAMTLKIIFEKLKVSAVIGSTVIILMALYSVFNIDGFIARYNINRYLNDTTKEIDMQYITNYLSVAAIPELNRMAEVSSDPEVKEKAGDSIVGIANNHSLFSIDNQSLAGWTWDYHEAMQIVDEMALYSFNYNDRDSAAERKIDVSDSDLAAA